METRTYYAEDMPTAMEQIKRELGVDAIIVRSRRVKQKYGPLGLFRKNVYEVVVSCEPETSLPPARTAFNMDARLKARAAQERRETEARPEEPPKAAPKEPAPEEKPVFTQPHILPEKFAQLMELSISRQETAEEQADMLKALNSEREAQQPAAVSSAAKLGAYTAMTGGATIIKPASAPAASAPAPAPVLATPVFPSMSMPATPAAPEAQPAIRKRGRPRKQPLMERPAAPAAAEAAYPPVPAPAPAPSPVQEDAAMARLEALEAMMREMHDKMMTDSGPRAGRKPKAAKAPEPGSLELLLSALAEQDVDSACLQALEKAARKHMAKGAEDGEAMRLALDEMLGKPRCMRASNKKKPRCILFVGPTGVGKTTTLVKLASGCVFERGAKVAIINADVFRVGAQDQLSAYARILNVPVTTIYNSDEIAAAVEAYKDYDFVFIDTSGKAPHDPDYQAELQRLMELGNIAEIYLTASSTSSGRVCRQLAKEYEGLGDYRIIVTKLDESGSYGALLNLRHASGKPLAYITTGQNVPDDIRRAEPEHIIEELLG